MVRRLDDLQTVQLSGCWKVPWKEKTISGGNGEGVPPVPIPNTEVKPFSAESTWLDTAREDRSPPDSTWETFTWMSLFFVSYTLISPLRQALRMTFFRRQKLLCTHYRTCCKVQVTIHCKCHALPDYLHGIDLFVSQLFCNQIMTVRIALLLHIWFIIQPHAIKKNPKYYDAKRQVPPFFEEGELWAMWGDRVAWWKRLLWRRGCHGVHKTTFDSYTVIG